MALGEDLPDHLDGLPDAGHRLLVAGHAVEALDPVPDRGAEAEDDPPAGEPVEVHGGHGDLERVAGEGDLDAAGDLDPRGDGGAEAHPHERVAVDLGDEDPRHPGRLDLLRLGGQHLPGDEGRQKGPLAADVVLHGVSPGGRARVGGLRSHHLQRGVKRDA